MANKAHFPLLLLAGLSVIFGWSAWQPLDRFTWFLEVFPVMIGVVILLLTYRFFRLTNFAYTMIALHSIVLLVGGHYTYSEMPLFDWIQNHWHLERNYYDRVGHIAQGFFPAIIAREILLRCSPLTSGGWLNFLVISLCLAISAFYELLEWWIAIASGSDAVAFLATQGDPWDTQWDMFLALIGAVAALILLTGLHNRALKQL